MKKLSTREILDSIKSYNLYCEHITLSTIFAKMGKGFNVINFAGPGVGKSTSSRDLIDQLGFKNEIILDNNVTKRGLFETIMNYPDSDIVLDECSKLLKDVGAQDMIKLCIDGQSLRWVKNNSVEETPPFTGNFIINTNVPVISSVIDRCYMNKVVMNKEMILSFIDYVDTKKNSTTFIEYVRSRIKDTAPVTLTDAEKADIKDFLKKHISESDEGLEYSRRCVARIYNYFICAKKLFGCLDAEVMAFIKPYAQLYVINAQTPSLIEAIVSNGPVDKAELIKKLAAEGGYHEGHARRLVNQAIESNTLRLKGRLVEKCTK